MRRRPKVSICIPTRNVGSHLADRLASIDEQTLTDWEAVVVDGMSTDGTWEALNRWGQGRANIRLERQAPLGIYPALNRCIELAQASYAYVATADDTMAHDCLEQLSIALDNHPEGGLAHCRPRFFGDNAEWMTRWWETASPFTRSSSSLTGKPHLRLAPHDGLLHFGGVSVYISLTQLLIRRELFSRIGFFGTKWGSAADFHWNMRAGLTTNTVHVPGTWGGWRLHPAQATAAFDFGSASFQQTVRLMIEDAIECSAALLPAGATGDQLREWWRSFRAWRDWLASLRSMESRTQRLLRLIQALRRGEVSERSQVWAYAWARLVGHAQTASGDDWLLRRWLRSAGVRAPLRPL